MTEPIFEHLREEARHAEHEAAKAAGVLLHGITGRFGHHGYDDQNSLASVPEGPAMDFDPAALATDMRNDLQAAEDKAGEVWNHVKTAIEQHLPQVEAVASKLGNDPLFKLAYDDTIPASIRQIGAELITKMVAAFPSPAAAPAEGDTTAPADGDASAQAAGQAPAAA
jgi:hypothetical protein